MLKRKRSITFCLKSFLIYKIRNYRVKDKRNIYFPFKVIKMFM